MPQPNFEPGLGVKKRCHSAWITLCSAEKWWPWNLSLYPISCTASCNFSI